MESLSLFCHNILILIYTKMWSILHKTFIKFDTIFVELLLNGLYILGTV